VLFAAAAAAVEAAARHLAHETAAAQMQQAADLLLLLLLSRLACPFSVPASAYAPPPAITQAHSKDQQQLQQGLAADELNTQLHPTAQSMQQTNQTTQLLGTCNTTL
jgi:hypothetical protein